MSSKISIRLEIILIFFLSAQIKEDIKAGDCCLAQVVVHLNRAAALTCAYIASYGDLMLSGWLIGRLENRL